MGEPDFSGWASKNDLVCADGRTIKSGAFAHHDKQRVPLVWSHQHGDPTKILGHAILENRSEGVYARGYLNQTEQGINAKKLLQHGDISSMSIYANNLKQRGGDVLHGNIREVSLVLAGANPGAVIENVNLAHGDGYIEALEDEAVIHTGLELEHTEEEEEQEVVEQPPAEPQTPVNPPTEDPASLEHAEGEKVATAAKNDATIEDVVNSMTEDQKTVLHYLVGLAAEGQGGELAQSAIDSEELSEYISHSIQEGFENMANVFETHGTPVRERQTLSHDQLKTIVADANRLGSLKESFLEHAEEYGVENIDFLFPDAQTLSNQPEWISRRMEWVKDVLGSTRNSPLSRVKSIVADITADEARAKGYVKGNLKKDEIIKLLKRVTTPKTIYKKQKLDRDDIVDITDLDIVAWLKAEMRLMLDEELARAILVGDGREPDDEDKIDEDHIRPIAFDNEMYSHKITLDGTPTPAEIGDAILRARKYYKGTGSPTLYTTDDKLTDLMLERDTTGHRIYKTEAELAAALRVNRIVVVEAMEDTPDVMGIIVNLADYTIGAARGGEISMFDDFDIDYNQQKYLIETRVSGALTKPKSAVVIMMNPGTVVTPPAPAFNTGTGVLTVPSQTGVIYKNGETGVTLTSGAQNAIASGDSIEVVAVADTGYSFPHGFDADWVYTRS